MNSLSKGLFIFRNGLNGKLKSRKRKSEQIASDFGKSTRYWDAEFENSWQAIQSKVDAHLATNNDIGLADLLDFVDESYGQNDANEADVSGHVYLPVASLLTGINKPDHHQYFKNLCHKLSANSRAYTVVLPARDCPNLKSTMEILVSCVLSNGRKNNYQEDDEVKANRSLLEDDSDEDAADEGDADEPSIKLRRSQYTLEVLKSWYERRYTEENRPKICVIIPNFEEMKDAVIVDLIRILSGHCCDLPFVLILGVATTTASIFHTLSFTETTSIKLRAFSSDSSVASLNRIIEDIVLSPRTSFHVSATIFNYLSCVFLNYDLTASEFLRALRLCMLMHYSQGPCYAVCASSCTRSMQIIEQMQSKTLSKEECEQIRHLPSFRPLVEGLNAPHAVLAILDDDDFLMNALGPHVRDVYCYFMKFHCYMRVLLILVKDLPHAPLGKRLRDIYPHCIGGDRCVVDTEEFEKCWQLMALMSKQDMANLLEKCCAKMTEYLEDYCSEHDPDVDRYVAEDARKCIGKTIEDFQSFVNSLSNVETVNGESTHNTSFSNDLQTGLTRQEFKQKMMEKAQQSRADRSAELKKLMDYLRVKVFGKYVLPSCQGPPLIELFVFTDHRLMQSSLKGAPRAAVHTALTNPQEYLQCDCCVVSDSGELRQTMPDISIAYKLLLECGQQVNLFDWLQAFKCIVDPDNVDDDEISPVVQARFTRARAELQFLGFIKSSKRKTDHVTRTTW